MAPYNNLAGLRFDKLYVIGDTGKRIRSKVVWLCRCECGNMREVIGSQLTVGQVHACKECAKISHQGNATKNQIRIALNNVYYHMKARCEDPKCETYKFYGARGISVCKEWSESLYAFREWAILNGYARGLSLERIDVNGNYCPENCKWIPLKEQGYNRRDTVFVHYKGKKMSLARICDDLNIDREKVRRYIRTNLKYAQRTNEH